MRVLIIDDDLEFAEVVGGMILKRMPGDVEVEYYTNALLAIKAMDEAPDLIFLDVLLDGPDAFTLLNEMQSYPDLAKVPIVLMTSLKIKQGSLGGYGVVKVLNKSEMIPEQIIKLVRKYGEQ